MRINNPARPGTTKARYHKGSGASNTYLAGAANWRWVGRDTIAFPRDVLAMRMGWANMNVAATVPTKQANALTIEGCYFGRPLLDAARPWTGFFRSPPDLVIPSFNTPADGSEGVSNWVTDRTVLPRARVKYGYSFSILAPTNGTRITLTAEAAFTFGNLVSVTAQAQAGAAHTPDGIAGRGSNQPSQTGYGPGVYWFEVILDGELPVIMLFGDSIGYGFTSDPSTSGLNGVFTSQDESYFGRAGLLQGFAAQNLSIDGILASNLATDPFSDYKWTRANFDEIQPAAVLFFPGRNDAANNSSLAGIQANMQTCLDNIRTRAPNAKIWLCTYPPGGFTNTGATTVNGAGQTPGTGGTLTVASTTGFTSIGSLTVAGLSALLHYTGKTATTFTGCTGPADAATNGGAVTANNNQPASQVVSNLNALSAWTAGLPYGAHGCVDFDAVLNPAGTPLDGSGNVVGDTRLMTPLSPHPKIRGVAAMSGALPSFGGQGLSS